MNLLNKVQELALQCRESDNYRLASILYSIATDIALVESNRYIQNQFKVAIIEAKRVKADLKSLHMYKLSEEIDIITKDLEAKLIQFSAEDPIEAVLNSYKIIHKVAQIKSEPTINMREILAIAENPSLSDTQIAEEVRKKTLGLPLEDKKNIAYILEKDYNLSIPLEKMATKEQEVTEELIENPKTHEEKEHNKKLVEEKVKKMEEISSKDKNKDKWMQAFPAQSSMWGGFSYEAIVPYQQSSQLNYWTLASNDEQKVLSKIARVQK